MKPENARTDRETPASFIERLTSGLRRYAQAKRDSVPPSSGYSELPLVAGNIETLSAWVAGLDTGDPRLYALMTGHTVLRDPDDPASWRPSIEQSRVLSRIGMNGKYDVDFSLTELAASVTEDIVTALRTQVTMADRELERLRAEVDELASIKAHVDTIKARAGMAATFREQDLASLARDARNSAVAAALEEAPPLSSPEDNELPEGVRAHGAGFQAYAKIGGRQRSKTFATIEAAVEWRDMQKVAA